MTDAETTQTTDNAETTETTETADTAETTERTLTVRIAARTETVWRYWTDPERMAQWWGTAARLDPRPGGVCRIEMGEAGPEAGGPTMSGEFVELVPYERIVFTFGWEPGPDAPAIPPGSTRVEVTLTAEGDDTVLTVRHSGIPLALGDVHHSGWAHHLVRLLDASGSAPQLGADGNDLMEEEQR